jgi:hypothetical protein
MPPTLGVTRLAAAGALAVFLIGLGYAVVSGLGTDDEAPPVVVAPAPVTTSTTKKPAVARPKAAPFVKLTAAGAFDPEGDGRERDEEAPLAVDGRADTLWRTERYSRFFKSGVGLVLDAGRRVRIEQVLVDTPTPGFRAEIRLGASPEGPFVRVSPSRRLTARTRFAVAKRPGRYVVVWITGLPPESAGEISEVRARARG